MQIKLSVFNVLEYTVGEYKYDEVLVSELLDYVDTKKMHRQHRYLTIR